MRVKINLNDKFDVCLTKEGAARLNACRHPDAHQFSQYDHCTMMLWELMMFFGPDMHHNSITPFLYNDLTWLGGIAHD